MPPPLTTLHLAHLPPDLAVHVAFYTDVRNAAFLREQLLKGNPAFEYAFVDARVILSPTHLLAAVFRAVNDFVNGRLRSRNVHSEVVVALGGNNNISHSLTTFGISATSTELLVVKIATAAEVSAESVAAHLDGAVEGTMGVFGEEDVGRGADVGRIRGVYRLGGGGGGGKGSGKRRRKDGGVEGSGGGGGGGEGNGDGERERRELEVNVLGLMALRGAL